MEGLLQGKVAVITGAGSGVGRAACLVFARHGARVVAADLDGAAAEATAAQVRDAGGEGVARGCDVDDPHSLDALIAAAVAAFGRLDVMYNNAGIAMRPKASKARLVDGEPLQTARLFALDLGGVINGCRAAIRQLEAQGDGGVIVTTDSVPALVGYVRSPGSGRSAVTKLTKSLAREVAAYGIRVNSIWPAGMPTTFKPDQATAQAVQTLAAQPHTLGRAITPEQCANAALFLASDLAANITGISLPVDGGLSAGVPPIR